MMHSFHLRKPRPGQGAASLPCHRKVSTGCFISGMRCTFQTVTTHFSTITMSCCQPFLASCLASLVLRCRFLSRTFQRVLKCNTELLFAHVCMWFLSSSPAPWVIGESLASAMKVPRIEHRTAYDRFHVLQCTCVSYGKLHGVATSCYSKILSLYLTLH